MLTNLFGSFTVKQVACFNESQQLQHKTNVQSDYFLFKALYLKLQATKGNRNWRNDTSSMASYGSKPKMSYLKKELKKTPSHYV